MSSFWCYRLFLLNKFHDRGRVDGSTVFLAETAHSGALRLLTHFELEVRVLVFWTDLSDLRERWRWENQVWRNWAPEPSRKIYLWIRLGVWLVRKPQPSRRYRWIGVVRRRHGPVRI